MAWHIVGTGYPAFDPYQVHGFLLTPLITTHVFDQRQTPVRFTLYQNYPNPFNSQTVITYQLPVAGHVSLKLYNLLGEQVALLVDGMQSAGTRAVTWNASGYPSGAYFYRLSTPGFVQTKKLLLVK